ncbi:hypothetical protein MLD38_012665 [Melastoma candidum]|uniref:Uncharacterized protein n=1 Tax=Melastoma candidum TaxID=119954 RepID=A0ACB9R8C6_9MYRT|nr:hypothetical protein MLD38_012665 [Melastoma candidum]
MALTSMLAILKSCATHVGIVVVPGRPFSSKTRYVQRTLFSRISPLGSPHESMTPVLDQWISKGRKLQAGELRYIIRNLRSRRRYKHALEVSEWMSENQATEITTSDHAVQLDLIGKARGLDAAERYFTSLSEQDRGDKTYGALLNCYTGERLLDKSLSLLGKMKELGYVSSPLNYNCLMCLYTNLGMHEKVPEVLLQMKEAGISPDAFSYRIALNSFGARSDLESMEKLFGEMKSLTNVPAEWVSYSTMVNYFIKAGRKERALFYLKEWEEIMQNDALAYNHLISLYASLGSRNEIMRLWELLKTKSKKKLNRDYITMLGSLVKLGDIGEAEKLLEEWEGSCQCYDFRVPNVVLIGHCQQGMVEKAEELLHDMIKRGKAPTPNSWAILSSGYMKKDNMDKAYECMKEALAVHSRNKDWRPKSPLVSNILSWLRLNKPDEAESFSSLLRTVPNYNPESCLTDHEVGLLEDVDQICESEEEKERVHGNSNER